MPVAVAPSPKSHVYAHKARQGVPLLVLADASKLVTSNAFGDAGVWVKLAIRFGLVGRMIPCGKSRRSIWRENSPRKSPDDVGVTPMVTVVAVCADGSADPAG